jgi:two-component system chemotaxis sensor kinase CheA
MDNDFQKRLLATFRAETRERLDAIAAGLIELEKGPAADLVAELVEGLFRETHSLKGAARSVGMAAIEAVSHGLESVFAALQRGVIACSPLLFDLLHTAIDAVGQFLPFMETGAAVGEQERLRELGKRLERAVQGELLPLPPMVPVTPGEGEEPAVGKPAPAQTVRVATDKLDAVLLQTEGMLAAKLAAAQRVEELRELGRTFALWHKEWQKVQPLLRKRRRHQAQAGGGSGPREGKNGALLDFLEREHASCRGVAHRLALVTTAAEQDLHHLGGMVDAVLDEVREALMLPFASILPLLAKSVRDLARDRGKDVELVTAGEAIEVDRRVLEVMKDPFVHLLRNCVDHGIERPAERERQGKGARGTISVVIGLVTGSRIEITIADDGAGIDPGPLRQAAARAGLVTPAEAERLTEDEALPLIFASGLSTSPFIDDISGRGLGLAIVREKVEGLGGTIAVESLRGGGTTFRITLPLTLSTFRGVLVEAAGQPFVVPTSDVERVARIAEGAIATVENRETVELAGEHLSFVRLGDVLGMPRPVAPAAAADQVPVFVLATGQGRLAFGVDRVIGEQEVLVKGLGKQLPRVRNFAGATVLGSGRVVPIINSRDLARSAIRAAATGLTLAAAPAAARKTVLVVEDSITARTLLKNILEGAGYLTRTAVDGVDALTLLRSEAVDLVVSDVDMPRMNGFELTAGIRASRELTDLPVVLVTSLDSRDDRERGVDAGANAYIVKSSFDQSNLLDVIRRLI